MYRLRCFGKAYGLAFVDIDATNVALKTWSAVTNEACVDVTGNDVSAVAGVVETWIDTTAIKLIDIKCNYMYTYV